MEFERRRYKQTLLNMTPLIDVIFNLLLFFMLTYRISHDQGIRVSLPSANTAVAETAQFLTITITHENEILLGGAPVPLAGLGPRLRAEAAGHRHEGVRVLADRDANVNAMVGVMDGVRNAGFDRFTIATLKGNEN